MDTCQQYPRNPDELDKDATEVLCERWGLPDLNVARKLLILLCSICSKAKPSLSVAGDMLVDDLKDIYIYKN